ncbi:hypothetical protein MMC17_006399 [Xylographa soralifera]|nr:hypothetical protein [Xylographa soralifera]
MTDTLSIPKEVLKNSWRFEHEDYQRAKDTLAIHHWDLSSLMNSYLDAQTKGVLEPPNGSSIKSLVNMTADRISDELSVSEDLSSDIAAIVDSLPMGLLRGVLRTGRIRYPVLRAILKQNKTGYGPLALLQDVDEAILRGTPHTDKHERYLVKLDELVAILGGPAKADVLAFQRGKPPPGGFEVLDARRKRSLTILANDSAVQTTFDRLTEGILKGLDWSNIVVGGGIVLQTLMATDSSKDNTYQVLESDIDLYIYGLDVEGANAKIEHVYDIWSKNLPNVARGTTMEIGDVREAIKGNGRESDLLANKIIVKNAKTINFITDYPTRRIQIILKLHDSIVDVFKDVDIDIFTMNLIWEHQHIHKRPTYEHRIFKYADRGYGLRILPKYMKALEAGSYSSRNQESQAHTHDLAAQHVQRYASLELYRKPSGAEPGLKTLKRVAYLGQNFVERWISYGIETRETIGNEDGDPHVFRIGRASTTLNQKYSLWMDEMDSLNDIPYVKEALLDIGSFEYFMRHCETWHLQTVCEIDIFWHLGRHGAETNRNPATTVSNYDSLPTYNWGRHFITHEYAGLIATMHARLSRDILLPKLCSRMGIGRERPGDDYSYGPWAERRDVLKLRDHLLKEIRNQVWGRDLQSVMRKEITTPLLIPYDVEEHIRSLLNAETNLPAHVKPEDLFVPILDSSHESDDAASPINPPLPDIISGEGNFRWWIISNRNMWAGQNHTLDEIFEVLWLLFGLYRSLRSMSPHGDHRPGPDDCTSPQATQLMARLFRRRTILLPDNVSPHISNPDNIDECEATLFRAWVFAKPTCHGESDSDHNPVTAHLPEIPEGCLNGSGFALQDKIQYPIPEENFWKEGDEGAWVGDYVSQWGHYTTHEILELDRLERQCLGRFDYQAAQNWYPRAAYRPHKWSSEVEFDGFWRLSFDDAPP